MLSRRFMWHLDEDFITFRVSCRRREMCIGYARLCVCLSVPHRIPIHYCTDPDVTCGMVRSAPSCALLGGFAIGAPVLLLRQRSADAKCQLVLVLALCLVLSVFNCHSID